MVLLALTPALATAGACLAHASRQGGLGMAAVPGADDGDVRGGGEPLPMTPAEQMRARALVVLAELRRENGGDGGEWDAGWEAALNDATDNIATLPLPAEPLPWRTMESAPRDGTEVLGIVSGRVRMIWWGPRARRWIAGNGGWIEPTHWMPVPAGLASQESAE